MELRFPYIIKVVRYIHVFVILKINTMKTIQKYCILRFTNKWRQNPLKKKKGSNNLMKTKETEFWEPDKTNRKQNLKCHT